MKSTEIMNREKFVCSWCDFEYHKQLQFKSSDVCVFCITEETLAD